jgi:zinc/manganese transport system substrate-binding protein
LIGAPFPASGPESEPSAASIRDLEARIRESGVLAVFAEATDDPEVMRQIAADTGVAVVTGLLVESPADAGGYLEMLRSDAALLGSSLAGG